MLFTKYISSAFLVALVSARAAPVSRDSPRGVVYEANFRQHGDIRGFVRFYSVNGVVRYVINVRGLPRRGGSFMYHVHQRRVPANGDCGATLGHFNPYDGVLNAPTPAEYEVGDLSGKHGLITGTSYRRTIEDPYISLNPQSMAFIGDLSVVFHLHDGTRIACANLVRERGGNTKRDESNESLKVDISQNEDDLSEHETDSGVMEGSDENFEKTHKFPGMEEEEDLESDNESKST